MMWLAGAFVLAQGILIVLLLYFVRTFGQYTTVLLAVHDENLTLRRVLAKQLNPPLDVHEGRPELTMDEVA